ncbi:MAG: oligosaccharide flippase family protein, partial [Clostridia bacterium]|nr:oligosaccharide flippase family protein [Clostridia bacterium]
MRKNNTVIGSATLVMAVVILSKILGFLRQTVIADAYGATLETDIYFLSSDFMISLSGAFLASLTTALVTVYIDIRTKKSKEEANTVASTMLTMFLFIGCVFILLINLFTPWIARLLESDYPPEAHNTLVQYLRIFSVTFIFTALQSIYAAVLNANNTFTPGKLYGIIYNPIAIFMVLAFAGRWGIRALIIAYFAANIIQTLLLGIWAKKNYAYRPSVNFRDPA